MSVEAVNNEVDTDITGTVLQDAEEVVQDVAEVQEYSEKEQQAIQLGWDPDFSGTEDKPAKTAEQYLEEGEKIGLRKQVREKDNYIKDLEAMVRSVDKRQAALEEEIYQRALKDIEVKRREAVETADAQAYDRYNEQYVELQEKQNQAKQHALPEVSVDDAAEVKSFQSRNKAWFNDNDTQSLVMSRDAIETETLIRQNNPDKSTGEVLEEVENYIKSKYNDFFRSNLRTKAAPMVPNVQNGVAKRKPTISDLTPSQKKVVNLYKDADGFDVEQYINELYQENRIPGFKRSEKE